MKALALLALASFFVACHCIGCPGSGKAPDPEEGPLGLHVEDRFMIPVPAGQSVSIAAVSKGFLVTAVGSDWIEYRFGGGTKRVMASDLDEVSNVICPHE